MGLCLSGLDSVAGVESSSENSELEDSSHELATGLDLSGPGSEMAGSDAAGSDSAGSDETGKG